MEMEHLIFYHRCLIDPRYIFNGFLISEMQKMHVQY